MNTKATCDQGEGEEVSLRPVSVVSVGPFGKAVARFLKTLRADVLEIPSANDLHTLLEMRAPMRIYVIAAWRPVPKLCELLDQASYEHKRPFIPLILDSRILRLGPVVLPGREGCWRCWTLRTRQHALWPKEQQALLDHYSSKVDAGPQGYLEPIALMAASRVSDTVDALDSSNVHPGFIWQIDIFTREIVTSSLIGIHGCPHCGLHSDETTRSVAELQEQLAYLWLGASTDGYRQ